MVLNNISASSFYSVIRGPSGFDSRKKYAKKTATSQKNVNNLLKLFLVLRFVMVFNRQWGMSKFAKK